MAEVKKLMHQCGNADI